MANLDFISYPIGQYITNNVRFAEGIARVPRIYAVNYFLKDAQGRFLTSKMAKKVWLQWAERRVHNEVDAHRTPLGFIPIYDDLKGLFQELLQEDFSRDLYEELFKFRVDPWIAKLKRAITFYKRVAPDCPDRYYGIWKSTIARLENVKGKYGPFVAPGAYRE
jgi:phosphoenolpyruvate carboxykinase (GTP)